MMLFRFLTLKIVLSAASLVWDTVDSELVTKLSDVGNGSSYLTEEVNKPTRNVTGRELYKELVDKLFKDISPVIPPNAHDLSQPVNLSMLMVLENLAYLDMKSQTLSIIAWFQIDWYDPALTWDTDIYPIDLIVVNEKDIWRPVLAIANTLLPRDQVMQIELPIAVYPDGTVRWFPGDSFIMSCHVNLNFYPFDEQTCEVAVTQWSHHTHHFQCAWAGIRSSVKGNGEWDITHLQYHTKVLQEPGYDFWILTYTITLKRKWMFYAISLIFPIILVSVLNSVVFMLPVDSGDKMSVSVTTFLTLVVFLTMIQDSLPKNSDTVCYLTVYLAVQTTLGALAIVQSALVVACRHRTGPEQQGHPERSSIRRPVYIYDPLEDEEPPDSRVLNNKEDSWGRLNNRQEFLDFDCDEQVKPGESSDRVVHNLNNRHGSCKRTRHRGESGCCKILPGDWSGMAAKIDRICFRLFIGLNVMSLFVFCVVINSA